MTAAAAAVTYRKKLIEVSIPLDDINIAAAREKSIRHGHPSTLHLWWSRKPLATCRAVLFASLVDDPSAHPDRFPGPEEQAAERERLFDIIRALVKWENSNNEAVLAEARAEIMASCDGDPPPVLDPFAGGGSIPLEAQRLGLEAHASDLNPVAVLINKALIEIPPRFAGQAPVHRDGRLGVGSWKGAQGLADDVRHYGRWMRDRAKERIGHLYPTVTLPAEHGGGEATVIAWIWARTVMSPNPAWNGHVPLVNKLTLSTKPGKQAWVEPIVDPATQTIRYEMRTGSGTVPTGTVDRMSVPPTEPDELVVEVVLDPGRQAELDPNYIAIVAFVTDASGQPVVREHTLQATARTGDVVDDTVFHLGYPHRDDPAADPGRYPGVVIVPYGGEWTISVNVFDRVAAETDAIPVALARGEVTLEVDAPFLPAAAAPSTGKPEGASSAELMLRIMHALIGLTWFAIAGLLAAAGMSRSFLRSGEIGELVERNLGRLVIALVWVTGLVWLSGVLSLRFATAFDPPLSPDQAERLFRVPYARAYTMTLFVKVATFAALTFASVAIVRRARRAVARPDKPANRTSLPLAVAVGGAIVLICVSVLTYLHTVSERVAG